MIDLCSNFVKLFKNSPQSSKFSNHLAHSRFGALTRALTHQISAPCQNFSIISSFLLFSRAFCLCFNREGRNCAQKRLFSPKKRSEIFWKIKKLQINRKWRFTFPDQASKEGFLARNGYHVQILSCFAPNWFTVIFGNKIPIGSWIRPFLSWQCSKLCLRWRFRSLFCDFLVED